MIGRGQQKWERVLKTLLLGIRLQLKSSLRYLCFVLFFREVHTGIFSLCNVSSEQVLGANWFVLCVYKQDRELPFGLLFPRGNAWAEACSWVGTPSSTTVLERECFWRPFVAYLNMNFSPFGNDPNSIFLLLIPRNLDICILGGKPLTPLTSWNESFYYWVSLFLF